MHPTTCRGRSAATASRNRAPADSEFMPRPYINPRSSAAGWTTGQRSSTARRISRDSRAISKAAGFVGSDFQKMVEAQAPLGRVGQPDDIAPTAVYLASSDSKYMTGETLLVAGGLR